MRLGEDFPFNPPATTQTITTTSGDSTLTIGPWYWPSYVNGPYYVSPYHFYQTEPAVPTTCVGKAHIFACDHVTACQCGAVTRANPVPVSWP